MRNLFNACALVALAALMGSATAVQAQVMNVPLPPLPPNQEMLVLEVNLAPSQSSNPHRHNAHVFLYVLEGRVNMQVAGGEMVTLTPGQMFYETPESIHSVSQNASDTETAKLLVHIIKTVGAPVTTPVSN